MRTATRADADFLRLMLCEAVWPGEPRPPISMLDDRLDLLTTIPDWSRGGDYAVIAEREGVPVGAAWYRLFSADDHAYGYVDDRTPELGIAVLPEWRARGIGRDLISALIERARRQGHPRLSLCGERGNEAAMRLYASLGFRVVAVVPDTDEQGMILALDISAG